MKFLNYTGLSYLIDKLKSVLVKKETVDTYSANVWQLRGHLNIGDTLPTNSMFKFLFFKRMENDSSGNAQYALLDEVTVPSWVLEQMSVKKIWSSSNAFFSINAYIEFNENLTVTANNIYSPSGGSLYVRLYYRALNPKGGIA